MNTSALDQSQPRAVQLYSETHLNGTSSLSRSTLSVLPYHCQMTPIWEEKEIQLIRVMVDPSLRGRCQRAPGMLSDRTISLGSILAPYRPYPRSRYQRSSSLSQCQEAKGMNG